MIMQFAMLLAIEFPDYDVDLVTGKRNLVVRLGVEQATRLYAVGVVSAFVVAALTILWGMPVWTAMLLVAIAPVAVLQVWLVHKVAKGDVAKTPWMAFLGVALFFAFASVQIVGYIL
jgi:1,4-dihydroxy-2-naphthoate octaprenyltransferase